MKIIDTSIAVEYATQAQQHCHRAWDCAAGPEFCTPTASRCATCMPNHSEYVSHALSQGIYDLSHNTRYTEALLANAVEKMIRQYNKIHDVRSLLSSAREFAAIASELSRQKNITVFGHWHRVYAYWHLALELDKLENGKLNTLNQHLREPLYGYDSYARELAEHVARGNPEIFTAPEDLLLSDLGVATEGLHCLGERIALLSEMVDNKTVVRQQPI